jgi:hypothetical protein
MMVWMVLLLIFQMWINNNITITIRYCKVLQWIYCRVLQWVELEHHPPVPHLRPGQVRPIPQRLEMSPHRPLAVVADLRQLVDRQRRRLLALRHPG